MNRDPFGLVVCLSIYLVRTQIIVLNWIVIQMLTMYIRSGDLILLDDLVIYLSFVAGSCEISRYGIFVLKITSGVASCQNIFLLKTNIYIYV